MVRYVEFVVQGNDRDLKGFLTGCFSVTTPPLPRIVFADEGGLHLHRLRERIKHHGEVQHLIVEEEYAARLREALAATGTRYNFEIKDERVVQTGIFAFEFDTPSREVADLLKELLQHLPVGAVLRNYEPNQESSDKDRGTELYTPAHDYRFSGRGEIRGDLFTVVDIRSKIAAVDFTRCGEIEIEDD